MREIKFRAWDGEKIVSPDYITRDGVAYWKEDYITCSSRTIMQFTGLKDKNGVEIYESDIIIDCNESHSGYNKPNLVKITPYGTQTNLTNSMGYWAWKWYEVIGNIYENPNLLEND